MLFIFRWHNNMPLAFFCLAAFSRSGLVDVLSVVPCSPWSVTVIISVSRSVSKNWPHRAFQHPNTFRMAEPPICIYCTATVSDKNSWDTFTKRCFFPSRAPLVPLKVVYRGSVTKSCTPTLRGQGDPRVSQPFWLRLCFRGILAMWLLVGSGGGKSLGRWYTFRSHFFGKNIRDFTDRKREDNQ